MNPKGKLFALIAFAGLSGISLSFAENHGAASDGSTRWLTQGSSPSTQIQKQIDPEQNDVVKSGPDVSPPTLIHGAKPKFSKAARKSRIHGNVLVNCYVERSETPSNVHAVGTNLFDVLGNVIPESTPAGQDLIKTAVDSVSKYRFKPAMKSGMPVKIELKRRSEFSILNENFNASLGEAKV